MSRPLSIGVLTPIPDGFYYGGLIDSIHSFTRKYGIRIFVIQTITSIYRFTVAKKSDYNCTLAFNHIDGWIILPQAINAEYLNILRQSGKPVVMVSREVDNKDCQVVLPDNVDGMFQAVEHLISHGHKKIAFVGCLEQYDMRQRFEGYLAALKKYDIHFSPDLLFNVSDSMQTGGHEAALKMAESGMQCTAIAAGCDFNALGIMEKLHELGYKVPEDISIIGFDNSELGKKSSPPLSSVHQNISELGTLAAEVLYKRILGEETQDNVFHVKTSLVIRSSCGCKSEEINLCTNDHHDESDKLNIINFMSDVIRSSYEIGTSLMKANSKEIRSLSWISFTSFNWGCLGIWQKNSRQKNLIVEQVFNSKSNLLYELSTSYPSKSFPPLEYLPDSADPGGEDIIWLHPIKTNTHEWGVLALIGPLTPMMLSVNYDIMSHCFDLLAFALEREALSEDRYRTLLDNAGQGFLSFGVDLLVDPEYSSECINIFKQNISGKVISDILCPNDAEQKQFFRSIMYDIIMESDEDKAKIYLSLLPEEIQLNNRFIDIKYRLTDGLGNKDKKKMMLILTDITEKRKLESKMEQEKKFLKMIVKTVVNYNEFADLIKDYKSFSQVTLPEIFNSSNSLVEAGTEILRNIHTFKGNFSQLDMVNIVDKLHDFESDISGAIKNIENFTSNSFKKFILSYNMLEWLDSDLDVLIKVLGHEYFDMDSMIVISENKLKEIEKKALNVLSAAECKTLLPELRRLRYKPFADLIKAYPEYVLKLSERLMKSIHPFKIEGGDKIFINTEKYHDFAKSLVNIFRNAAEHGIEPSINRIENAKDEFGSIECFIELKGSNIIVTISDDGAGIDCEVIRKKALKKQIYDMDTILAIPDDKIIDLIFEDEFSTKDIVTEISGRGVGLSAVKQEVEKLGGKIEVKSKKGEGTIFRFILPHEDINDSLNINVTNILSPIFEATKQLFCSNFNFKLQKFNRFRISLNKRISLNDITGFIDIKGAITGRFVVSIDENLAANLAKKFLIASLPPEEENMLIEDVLAECTNTILGNSIDSFGSIEEFLIIDSPVTVYSNGGFVKHKESELWTCSINFSEGNITLGLYID